MWSFDVGAFRAASIDTLRAAGLGVLASQDFDQIADLWPQTGRAAQSPMMSLDRQEFTQRDAFWLFLMDGDDAIGGLGVKFVDLRDETFESYLRRTSRAQYARETDPIASVAKPLCQIAGKLIYFGELELREDRRGSPKVLAALADLAKCTAALQWSDFDWMYAFIQDAHIRLAPAYAMSYHLPGAITWHDPVPDGRRNDHWIIATDRASFLHQVEARKP